MAHYQVGRIGLLRLSCSRVSDEPKPAVLPAVEWARPAAISFADPAADQPQWGQAWSRNMVSPEQGLPESFDPQSGRNILWSAELGTETHSSPVVAGGRSTSVLTTATRAIPPSRATAAC